MARLISVKRFTDAAMRYAIVFVLPTLAGCQTLSDVAKAKHEGTSVVYPVAADQAWTIAMTVFRQEGADAIEEHRAEGYMLTSSSPGIVTYGTVMGAWIDTITSTQTQVTVVTKRRVVTNLVTTLTENTFHRRFAEAVERLKAGTLPPQESPSLSLDATTPVIAYTIQRVGEDITVTKDGELVGHFANAEEAQQYVNERFAVMNVAPLPLNTPSLPVSPPPSPPTTPAPSNYVPLVDAAMVKDPEKFRQDLAQCRDLASANTPTGQALTTGVEGAAAGAALGALVGLAIGAKPGHVAPFGALSGGVGGLGTGAVNQEATFQQIYKNCMIGRGWQVLR